MSMKVRIDKDEWYPVYSVVDDDDTYGFDLEADPAAVERWKKAEEAFKATQDEISVLAEAAANAQRERNELEKAEKAAALKAEQERVAEAREAERQKRDAAREEMWSRIQAEGGVVYDSKGNRIGTLGPAQEYEPYGRVTITP